jgi:hypothetical protein
VETTLSDSQPKGQSLEQLIRTQALTTDLKPAVLACLTGTESRRWTIAELSDRLHNLGITCSKPAIVGALTELELEISLCSWLPWTLIENGTEWSLVPKSELLGLLSGVRKLPGVSADTLTDEDKAVLLVVIGHRRTGGVSKTRIAQILNLDAAPRLEKLREKNLVYTASGKELNWWRPTPEALLALGLRSTADIPELRELEHWFDSQKSFGTQTDQLGNLESILQKAQISRSRRRRRELERRISAPEHPSVLNPSSQPA